MIKEKHADLLLIGEKGKGRYVLIKDFNTFMYDHILHHEKKHFCRYCLQAFSTEEILNVILKTALKLMANNRL